MAWLTKWLTSLCLIVSVSAFANEVDASRVTFKKKKISINNAKLTVEIAETPAQQQQGLMYRTSLGPNAGMLFIFPDEADRAFWMKNTYIDLSIGYFDKNRKLFEVLDMKATTLMQKNLPSYPSSKPAQYALEVPLGWFTKHRIKPGDFFKFD